MIITTSQDRTAVDCCACGIPECDAPRKQCESISVSVSSTGHVNPADEVWKRYKKFYIDYGFTTSPTDPSAFIDSASSFHSENGTEYDQLYSITFENPGDGCENIIPVETVICIETGSKTYSSYEGTGDPPERGDQIYGFERHRINREGTETEEHSAWEDTWTDSATWQAAHDEWVIAHAAWVEAHAAWQAALDEWNEIYLEWVDAYNAWDTGGQIGPAPEEPAPFTDEEPEEPPEPDAEPDELYGPCSFADVTTETNYTVEPAETSTVTEGASDRDGATSYSNFAPADTTYTSLGDIYDLPVTYAEWKSSVQAALTTALDFDTCENSGTDCLSAITYTPAEEPDPEAGEVSATATKARYRFGIPSGYPRSTWEMQWDEVFFPAGYDATIDDPGVTPPDPLPEGWEHPQIPDPEAPPPTLVSARSWTWGGDTGEPWSDWFEIPIPEEPGETRPVNVMVKCYKSTRIGVVPTAHGETYVVP